MVFSKTVLSIFLFSFLSVTVLHAQTTPAQNCSILADLVFVLDKSGSIGSDNFNTALAALDSIVEQLTIGTTDDTSHVGLVTFDDTANIEFDLAQYTDKYSIIAKINTTYYSSGSTNISLGMNVALTQVFGKKGDRSNVPNVMILITDGQDTSNVAAEHQIAVATNVTTFALGVGDGVDTAELDLATGDPSHVFNISDWNQATNMLNHMCVAIASIAPPTRPMPTTTKPSVPAQKPRQCSSNIANLWMDIVIILDGTQGVDAQGLYGVKAALSGFLQAIPISQQIGQYSRVAFIEMGARAHRISNLTSYSSSQAAINDLSRKMPYLGDKKGDLAASLSEAKKVFDQTDMRGNVKNMIIVLSSIGADCSKQQQEPCRIAAEIQDADITILTVALKFHETDVLPIMNFGTPCFSTQNDDQLYNSLVSLGTQANCFCFDPYAQFVDADSCQVYAECDYLVDTPSQVLPASQIACAPQNATLADVLTPQKQAFLDGISKDHNNGMLTQYWIGLSNQDGPWQWNNMFPFDGNYQNWASGQPDPNLHCVSVFQDKDGSSKWMTEKCNYIGNPEHIYFCQRYACDADNYCDAPWSNDKRKSSKKVKKSKFAFKYPRV